jgi:hypothetical protein
MTDITVYAIIVGDSLCLQEISASKDTIDTRSMTIGTTSEFGD